MRELRKEMMATDDKELKKELQEQCDYVLRQDDVSFVQSPHGQVCRLQ